MMHPYLFGLALSRADDHIESIHLVDLELAFLDLLLEGLLVDDHIVPIDEVFLELMG